MVQKPSQNNPFLYNKFTITDTLSFPELLKNGSNDGSFKDVSFWETSLFEKLNSYHPNIKLSIGKYRTEFLDTGIIWRVCEIETEVYRKSKKLPVHCSSKTTSRYQRNAIMGESHRARRIANDFSFEMKRITKEVLSAGFPRNFIGNTIEYFN